MHRRLVAMGRAAAAYGKFQAAREAFAAAGQWVELMPLCALQGDFDSLRDYAARVSGSPVSLACSFVTALLGCQIPLGCSFAAMLLGSQLPRYPWLAFSRVVRLLMVVD